jgi:hypothetical protein
MARAPQRPSAHSTTVSCCSVAACACAAKGCSSWRHTGELAATRSAAAEWQMMDSSAGCIPSAALPATCCSSSSSRAKNSASS